MASGPARAGGDQKDDWAWTLRSAANRPLLRWLEDGPLVVVSDGSGAAPKLKARLIATGQAGTFGEGGERYSASVEDTPANSRNCWRAWTLPRTAMPAWNPCWVSARILALRAPFNPWPPWPFTL